MELLNEQQLLSMAAERGAALSDGRVVLYAGANLPSEEARRAYAPELSAYPAMGPSFAKEQPDTDLVSGLEIAVRERICSLFGATWAEPRLPSCTIANLAVFHAFSRPGDLLLAPAAAHGGHLSQRRGGTPELAGLRVADLPFDTHACRLDAKAAAEQVRELRPALVMLGRSVIVTPDDIEPVIAAAREVGAKTIYDASHVSGLIAGGTFPNPLALGVDILTSSTYKTLPGRPHSLIAGRDVADGERLACFIDRALLANYDAGKLPAFLVTLQQAQADGGAYARRICAASETFAQVLRERDVAVIAPAPGEVFTHQVLVPMSPMSQAAQEMKALELLGILVGTCADPTTPGGYALRVGTQFIVAQGQDAQVADIARRLAAALRRAGDGRMVVKG
ncbi:glycine hydroxymethyltransferase [Pseudomonas daroniae]|uniref:Glycine hydroxymethyltransferase n=1 Tax=Phytopseudomonas daroniae TaxID=2487519 RepID=A0A4Q9QKK5_9GAMM|nr:MULTISPECIES: glycine hydroxymethyltransferase [Pseudomonas]TBU76756.1 glycine hydroxymethyltransferase [Pseudomonas daroniae]TBU81327.1 glycine hydroxymethyltransferase [Pseudomonas sp. FRB 228]TBU90466.1 glycine hydroxymethyltransferase [Pseudomonas daroniae]